MQVYNININENKMETTSHGTEEFPIAIYETILRKNILGFVDWHWHSELQFCFITSGTVRFTVNSFSADLEKGNGIFINSGIMHTSKPLTEDAVAGYTSTVDGYNVTNNHTPATVKVSGTKTWKDNNNQDGIRPSSITVNLLANGRQVASKTVSASDNWQYSFDNLAAYANGQKITYTVTENAVAGYTSTVDGYNITNTHNPTTPKKPQVPNNPTTPKKPQVPNNENKVIPKAYTQGKTYEKTGKLPQTGNESSMGMMLIGLVTLLLSLGLVVINRFTI